MLRLSNFKSKHFQLHKIFFDYVNSFVPVTCISCPGKPSILVLDAYSLFSISFRSLSLHSTLSFLCFILLESLSGWFDPCFHETVENRVMKRALRIQWNGLYKRTTYNILCCQNYRSTYFSLKCESEKTSDKNCMMT